MSKYAKADFLAMYIPGLDDELEDAYFHACKIGPDEEEDWTTPTILEHLPRLNRAGREVLFHALWELLRTQYGDEYWSNSAEGRRLRNEVETPE
jgi:hypothetical protein